VSDDGTTRAGGAAAALEGALTLLLRACRSLVAVPVVVLAASAVIAFAYDCYLLVSLLAGAVRSPGDTARFAVALLKVADVALIGVVAFVAAVGLEELFLSGREGRLRALLPAWLAMDDLNDLKEILLSTLVLVVVVTFVDAASGASGSVQVLELGAAAALVVVAIAFYLRLTGRSG
jgi:uncharacterized membrane protein YqhA